MPELIIYATKKDSDAIRLWLNAEPDISWIVKIGENNGQYDWKAVSEIDLLEETTYGLWPNKSGLFNVPNADTGLSAAVLDPHKGWQQNLRIAGATQPWFGAEPTAFSFDFRETGRRDPSHLGRSGFSWLGNRLGCVGRPAHPAASQAWRRLRNFVEKSTFHRPWIAPSLGKRIPTAFVFPDAYEQIEKGREREVNP